MALFLVVLSLLSVNASFAQNKDIENNLTRASNLKKRSLLLATGEAIVGGVLVHQFFKARNMLMMDSYELEQVRRLQSDLDQLYSERYQVQKTPIGNSQSEALQSIQNRIRVIEAEKLPSGGMRTELAELYRRKNRIQSGGSFISASQKRSRLDAIESRISQMKSEIRGAKMRLNLARKAEIKRLSFKSRVWLNVRVISGALLLIDATQKAYIWFSDESAPREVDADATQAASQLLSTQN